MEFRGMRRFNQQISYSDCIRLLEQEPRGVLAVNGENGYPYALPVDFWYNPENGKIYFHGAKEGNKIDLLKQNNKVSFCVMDKGYKIEGEWPLHIRSVIIYGRIRFIDDPEKTVELVRELARRYYPGEEEIEYEIQRAGSRIQMLELIIDHMTGKEVKES